MKIGGLIKSSLLDYPGKVAAVIFTQGCNFRCPYCHNKHLVVPSDFQPSLDPKEVLAFLSQRIGVLDGIVVTGGEPTIHKDLGDFLKEIKQVGFAVKLDTNGSRPDVIASLIEQRLVDYIAMDIKAPLEKYKEIAGVDCDIRKILETIGLIQGSGIQYEFRTTLIKKFHRPLDVVTMALLARKNYRLQPFVPRDTMIDPSWGEGEQYSDTDLNSFRTALGMAL